MTSSKKDQKKVLSEMTIEDAKRIQSAEAKANGGKIDKDCFAARAMRAGKKNEKNSEK